tara:strand:+ start:744 stop:1088 length:345 start_codon:yes stop_codon:yes gene_type:complete
MLCAAKGSFIYLAPVYVLKLAHIGFTHKSCFDTVIKIAEVCMKLSAWLKENDMTQKQFLYYVTRNHNGSFSSHAIAKWCNGQRIPRPHDMKIIHRATFGAVTPNDFYGLQKSQA